MSTPHRLLSTPNDVAYAYCSEPTFPVVCVPCRENAEAIAFYGGDVREASDLSSRLLVVLDVLLRRIAWLGGYELWLVVYR